MANTFSTTPSRSSARWRPAAFYWISGEGEENGWVQIIGFCVVACEQSGKASVVVRLTVMDVYPAGARVGWDRWKARISSAARRAPPASSRVAPMRFASTW